MEKRCCRNLSGSGKNFKKHTLSLDLLDMPATRPALSHQDILFSPSPSPSPSPSLSPSPSMSALAPFLSTPIGDYNSASSSASSLSAVLSSSDSQGISDIADDCTQSEDNFSPEFDLDSVVSFSDSGSVHLEDPITSDHNSLVNAGLKIVFDNIDKNV